MVMLFSLACNGRCFLALGRMGQHKLCRDGLVKNNSYVLSKVLHYLEKVAPQQLIFYTLC